MLRAGSATRRRQITQRISLSGVLPSYLGLAGDPDASGVVIEFFRDGTYWTYGSSMATTYYTYATPWFSTVGDAYEVRLTATTSSPTGGGLTSGVWYPLTTSREYRWEMAELTGPGSVSSGPCEIDIRSARTQLIMASATSSFTAELNS